MESNNILFKKPLLTVAIVAKYIPCVTRLIYLELKFWLQAYRKYNSCVGNNRSHLGNFLKKTLCRSFISTAIDNSRTSTTIRQKHDNWQSIVVLTILDNSIVDKYFDFLKSCSYFFWECIVILFFFNPEFWILNLDLESRISSQIVLIYLGMLKYIPNSFIHIQTVYSYRYSYPNEWKGNKTSKLYLPLSQCTKIGILPIYCDIFCQIKHNHNETLNAWKIQTYSNSNCWPSASTL